MLRHLFLSGRPLAVCHKFDSSYQERLHKRFVALTLFSKQNVMFPSAREGVLGPHAALKCRRSGWREFETRQLGVRFRKFGDEVICALRFVN